MFDVFSLSGRRILRVDLAKIISENLSKSIKLKQLDHVLIPVLKWTGRRSKLPRSFGMYQSQFDVVKVVLVGKVTVDEGELLNCLMIFNLESTEVEKLKILAFTEPHVQVNSITYGPFDSGHILLGMSDGWLLAYEYPSLERVDSKQIYFAEEERKEYSISAGDTSPKRFLTEAEEEDQAF